MQIDPTKTAPQAPRVLRVGSRGFARAVAARMAGKMPPDAADDDDEDEREEDSAAIAPPDGEADKAELGKCADTCEAAAEACTAAAQQLATQAKELRSGTDSISSLQATEATCQAADEALDEAAAAMAALRGAEPPADPDSIPPPAPAPEGEGGYVAPSMRVAPLGTTEAAIEREKLAAFGLYALGKLGLAVADVVKAKGVLGSKLDMATRATRAIADEKKTKAASDVARREKLWEDAVRDRRVQLAQAFVRVDSADGPPRVYAKWAQEQNAAYPEIDAFEAWITSRVPEPGNTSLDPSTVLADADDRAPIVNLTARDKREALRAGVDPEALAAALRRQRTHRPATEERGA